MSNHVNDIEQISRQAAENFDAGIDPRWDQFLPKLNEAMPQPAKRRRVLLWWFIMMLLIAIGTWIGYHYWQSEKSENPSNASKPDALLLQPNTNHATKKIPIASQHTDAIPKNENTNDVHLQQVVAPPQKEIAIPLNNSKAIVSNKFVHGYKRIAANSGKKTSAIRTNTFIEAAKESKERHDDNVTWLNSSTEPIEKVQTSAAKSILPPQKDVKPQVNTVDTIRAEWVDSSSMPRKQLQSAAPTWSVELFGATDMSTVRFTYAQNVSYGVGAVVGYHFNAHWSAHAGILYTQKKYKVAGADFQVPKSSWLSNYNISKVAGTCSMWELPLMGRYTFHLRPKQSFFASAGMSTYFMQREKYTYQYAYQQRLVSRTVQYSNKNNYWFAIAHVSAGISKSLLPNVWLQIEPYAKIPLKGVGFGSIALTSTGVNVGVQWRLPRH